MTTVLEVIFWIFVCLILYVYFGYPLLLIILSKFIRKPVKKGDITPSVSLIIAAYNEEKVIAQKIENSLALDYPKDKLEVIIGSDGSTDRTNEIVTSYTDTDCRVRFVAFNENRGKSAVQNDAVAVACGEILVFSDATGMLQSEAIRQLVKFFADDHVGCVGGAVCDRSKTDTAVTKANNIYWHYEEFLRSTESRFGSLAMVSGSLFALRRCLFQPLPQDVGDDFVLPLSLAKQGYRTLYYPGAISADQLSSKSSEKFRQKIRIVSKDLRGLFYQRILLNPFRFPRYAFSLWSHKLLRWMVPFWLMGLLVTNVLLNKQQLYAAIFGLQTLFYLFAIVGLLLYRINIKIAFFYIPFYFCLLNLAASKGIWDYMRGKRVERWQMER